MARTFHICRQCATDLWAARAHGNRNKNKHTRGPASWHLKRNQTCQFAVGWARVWLGFKWRSCRCLAWARLGSIFEHCCTKDYSSTTAPLSIEAHSQSIITWTDINKGRSHAHTAVYRQRYRVVIVNLLVPVNEKDWSERSNPSCLSSPPGRVIADTLEIKSA